MAPAYEERENCTLFPSKIKVDALGHRPETHRLGSCSTSGFFEKGHFEFELPAGTYDVTTAKEYGLRRAESLLSMQGGVPVQNGKCREHNFAAKRDTGP